MDPGSPTSSVSTASAYRPAHPIEHLQGPFEESILESVHGLARVLTPPDAVARRKLLLQSPQYLRSCSGKWQQRPGERYHPLWKIMAQVSFGVHLLATGCARSEPESVQILRLHVAEIDGFVRRTMEDFQLAHEDLAARFDLLAVPLANLDVLDAMLADEAFKLFLVDCVGKINHVVRRSETALQDALKDLRKAAVAVRTVRDYLNVLPQRQDAWSPSFGGVYADIFQRVGLWLTSLTNLQTQGVRLIEFLVNLSSSISRIRLRIGLNHAGSTRSVLSPDLLSRAVSMENLQPRRVSYADKPLPDIKKNRSVTSLRRFGARLQHRFSSASNLPSSKSTVSLASTGTVKEHSVSSPISIQTAPPSTSQAAQFSPTAHSVSSPISIRTAPSPTLPLSDIPDIPELAGSSLPHELPAPSPTLFPPATTTHHRKSHPKIAELPGSPLQSELFKSVELGASLNEIPRDSIDANARTFIYENVVSLPEFEKGAPLSYIEKHFPELALSDNTLRDMNQWPKEAFKPAKRPITPTQLHLPRRVTTAKLKPFLRGLFSRSSCVQPTQSQSVTPDSCSEVSQPVAELRKAPPPPNTISIRSLANSEPRLPLPTPSIYRGSANTTRPSSTYSNSSFFA